MPEVLSVKHIKIPILLDGGMGKMLSGHGSEVRWLHTRLVLELGGEIVGRLEVEAIGYFLDAFFCGGEKLLGSLQF